MWQSLLKIIPNFNLKVIITTNYQNVRTVPLHDIYKNMFHSRGTIVIWLPITTVDN